MTDRVIDLGDGIRVERTLLDAQRAHELLQRNGNNRAVRQLRVRQYGNDLRKGRWTFTGEAIKVAHTGQLLDGQHRLAAIVDADVAMDVLLITGLPHIAQASMDQGNARTFSDWLKIQGESEYTTLAAAVRLVYLYERDGVPVRVPGTPAPSTGDLIHALRNNGDLRESVRKVRQLTRSNLLPVSAASALHYLFAIVDEDEADDFFKGLLRGQGLEVISPVYVLRDRLIHELSQRGSDRSLTSPVKLAFTIRAWNANLNGEIIHRLTHTPGQRFPGIAGLEDPRDDAASDDSDDAAAEQAEAA
jgi:hypothetical protein